MLLPFVIPLNSVRLCKSVSEQCYFPFTIVSHFTSLWVRVLDLKPSHTISPRYYLISFGCVKVSVITDQCNFPFTIDIYFTSVPLDLVRLCKSVCDMCNTIFPLWFFYAAVRMTIRLYGLALYATIRVIYRCAASACRTSSTLEIVRRKVSQPLVLRNILILYIIFCCWLVFNSSLPHLQLLLPSLPQMWLTYCYGLLMNLLVDSRVQCWL